MKKISKMATASVLLFTLANPLGVLAENNVENISATSNNKLTQDITIQAKEVNGGIVFELTAVKDTYNTVIHATINGQKFTYNLGNLKKGQVSKVVQPDVSVNRKDANDVNTNKKDAAISKENKSEKSLPNTSVVRELIEKTVSYNTELNGNIIEAKVVYKVYDLVEKNSNTVEGKKSITGNKVKDGAIVKPEVLEIPEYKENLGGAIVSPEIQPELPKAEEPAAGTTPKAEEPAATTPKAEEPAAGTTPKAEEPAAGTTPKAEEPAATTPKAEEPAAGTTPKAEEPAAGTTPKAEEPAAGTTPKAEEPAAGTTPKAEEPAVGTTPKAEEPAVGTTPKAEEPAAGTTPKAEESAAATTPKVEEPAAGTTPKAEEPAAGTTPKAEESAASAPKEDTPSEEVAPKDEKLEEAKKDGKNIIEKIAASKLSEIEKVKDEAEKAKLEAKLKELKEAGLAAINNAKNHDAAVDATDEYQTKIDEINVPGEELPTPNYNKDNLSNGRNEGTTIDNGSTAIGHGASDTPSTSVTKPTAESPATTITSPVSSAQPTNESSASTGAKPAATSETSSFRKAPEVQVRAKKVVKRDLSNKTKQINIYYNLTNLKDIAGALGEVGENNMLTLSGNATKEEIKKAIEEKTKAQIEKLKKQGFKVASATDLDQIVEGGDSYDYVVEFTKESKSTSVNNTGFRKAPLVQKRAKRSAEGQETVDVNIYFNLKTLPGIAGALDVDGDTTIKLPKNATEAQVKAAIQEKIAKVEKRGYKVSDFYFGAKTDRGYDFVVEFKK